MTIRTTIRQSTWIYNSPGSLTNYNKKMPIRRAVAGVLKIADYCLTAFPCIANGRILLDLRIGMVGHEQIFNSKGETFEKVWERRKRAYPLGKTSDPRFWPVDLEEIDFVKAFHRMGTQELELVLRDLIRGKNAVIESSEHFLKEKNALVAFLDNLSSSNSELDHHFRSPLGRVVQVLSLVNLEKQDGGLSEDVSEKYADLLERAYKYKAFMRELVKRWSETK